MPKITLYLKDAQIRSEISGVLTSGMVGVEVSLVCDDSWNSLNKTLVCRAGDVTKTVLVQQDRAVLAHETMVAGKWLELGVTGRNADGTVVIPTLWERCCIILPGVDDGADPTVDPTLPVWEQILGMIGDLSKSETEAKGSVVAAINEVAAMGAAVDTETMKGIVEAYLEEHLVKTSASAESDPTVFDWAKKELFCKSNFVDPENRNTFVTIDGVEYYRYHASAGSFEYHNPYPLPGSVQITMRVVAQYDAGGSKIYAEYTDGTNEMIGTATGETFTFTTPAEKTLSYIRGSYDKENWQLMDMSVMSMTALYNIGLPLANENAPGGIKADPATEADTQSVRIGEDGKLYTAPCGGSPEQGSAKESAVLAEFTLTEDVDGEIRIPLSDNPFAYSKLLIEIKAQLVSSGKTQYMGNLYGSGKHSQVFHLNTVFSDSSVRTVYIMTHLFHDAVHSIAARKGDYMWNTTNHYTDVYPINAQSDANESVLEIKNCSAVSGATFKVQGVK